MRVSCIILTRDRVKTLMRAVESVRVQTALVSEIVVVDAASLDGAAKVIAYCHPDIKLVSAPGADPGPAWNLGAAVADGDILMFLDSGDLWLSNHVQDLRSCIEQGFEAAFGVTLNTDLVRGGDSLIPDNLDLITDGFFRKLLGWCFLTPSSAAVTRAAFERAGGFGTSPFTEDSDFFLRVSIDHDFGFAPEIITHCLLRRGSLNCLKTGGRRIDHALNHIMDTLEETGRGVAEDYSRLSELQVLAAQQGEACLTVQDFYMALKQWGYF